MNGFSKEWEKIYDERSQLTSWPWSDVVSFVYRFCKDSIENGTVLELGCGSGPNIPFFVSLGMDYHGIEGSKNIVDSLIEKYPNMRNKVVAGDFTKEKSFPITSNIDIILDRAAVTHNNLEDITRTLKTSLNSLKSNGYFIGIDWFSTKHSDYKLGQESSDEYTRTNIQKGQFLNVGNVHFSDEGHLRNIFSNYEIILLEEKVVTNSVDNHIFGSWNIIARKK